MDCVFQLSADGKLWLGVHCSHAAPVLGPKPPKRNCKETKPKDKCRHRGEYHSTRECETCVGRVKIKLYACTLHTVCTIGKRIDMLACCAQCGDYEAARRDTADDGRAG